MIRFAIIFLFLAMAGVLFFTQTQPYYDQVKALKEDRQSFEEALARSRELQTLRDELLIQYNAIPQEDLERLNKLLPSQLDSGALVVMLEERMKVYGLLLKKIDVKEYKPATDPFAVIGAPLPSYKTINLAFAISGSYSSFLQLLSDLETSLRVIDIEDINFSSGGTLEFLEFTVTARTYAAAPSAPAVSLSSEEKGGEAREILAMLTKLRAIKIDSDFFRNEVFRSLVDFGPDLEMPKEYGRPNPFLPVEGPPVPVKK